MKKRVWIDVLTVLFAGALLFAATSTTPTSASKKKASSKKASSTNKPISTAKKSTAKRRKPAVASWRNTQKAPTSDRYKEIQQALASKGYLGSGSVEALKKFQADQSLEPSGKLDSVSLIALGLGPRHEQPPAPHQ